MPQPSFQPHYNTPIFSCLGRVSVESTTQCQSLGSPKRRHGNCPWPGLSASSQLPHEPINQLDDPFRRTEGYASPPTNIALSCTPETTPCSGYATRHSILLGSPAGRGLALSPVHNVINAVTAQLRLGNRREFDSGASFRSESITRSTVANPQAAISRWYIKSYLLLESLDPEKTW